MFSGTNGMASSLTLIQSLRMHQADTQSQIAAMSAKFGPAYPKLAEMQSQLEATDEAIRQEVKRITERAQTDYEVALQVEENTHNFLLDQKHQADLLNDKAMEYTILRQEADGSRALYEGLYSQMKQAGILADFHSNNIAIVDSARIPANPARPMVLLYMLHPLVAGYCSDFAARCCAMEWTAKFTAFLKWRPDLAVPLSLCFPITSPPDGRQWRPLMSRRFPPKEHCSWMGTARKLNLRRKRCPRARLRSFPRSATQNRITWKRFASCARL